MMVETPSGVSVNLCKYPKGLKPLGYLLKKAKDS